MAEQQQQSDHGEGFEYFPVIDGAVVPVRVSVKDGKGGARLTMGYHGGTGTYGEDEFTFSMGMGGTVEVRFKGGPTFEVNVRDLVPVAHAAWKSGKVPANAF